MILIKNTNLRAAYKMRRLAEEESIDAITDFVTDHGGFIDLSNTGKCDTIYVLVWEDDGVEEYEANAIMVKNGSCYVHVYNHYDFSGNFTTREEAEKDENNWFLLKAGSDVILGPTLDFLMEAIEEYV